MKNKTHQQVMRLCYDVQESLSDVYENLKQNHVYSTTWYIQALDEQKKRITTAIRILKRQT